MPIQWLKNKKEIQEVRKITSLPDDFRTESVVMSDGRYYFPIEIGGKIEYWHFPRHQWDELEKWDSNKPNRKQRQMFMRINSGIQYGIAKKERLIFLTLTTQYEPTAEKQKEKFLNGINKPFTLLKQKIERYLRRKMYISYCIRHNLTPFSKAWRSKETVNHPKIWEKCKFKLKYFKVKTSEGAGVLHIVFRKGYGVPKIPRDWLSKEWAKLWHGSWNVDIRQIKYNQAKKVTSYIIGNYIQNQPVIRMSYGHQWVYQGFRKSFIHLIEVYGFKRGLEIWKKNMEKGIMPTKAGTYQTRFRYRKAQNKTYNKRFFDLNGYSPAKLDITERHILVRYPDNCYAWEYKIEETVKLKGGKIVINKPQKVKGRLLKLPRGKVKIKLTEQSTLFPFDEKHFMVRSLKKCLLTQK